MYDHSGPNRSLAGEAILAVAVSPTDFRSIVRGADKQHSVEFCEGSERIAARLSEPGVSCVVIALDAMAAADLDELEKALDRHDAALPILVVLDLANRWAVQRVVRTMKRFPRVRAPGVRIVVAWPV